MYWSPGYWARDYWGPRYWGATGATDCSGGPYVISGYWEYGYAQCDALEMAVVISGGGVERRLAWGDYRKFRPQPKRPVDVEDDAWFALLDRWESDARKDADRQGSLQEVEQKGAIVPDVVVVADAGSAGPQAKIGSDAAARRKRVLSALLLLVDEL